MAEYDHLLDRIQRIHRRLGDLKPEVPERFQPFVVKTTNGIFVHQDFRGGLSDAQIREKLNYLFYEIAHVKDLAKNWLKKRDQDPKKVKRFIDQHSCLQVIINLANADKHGYPCRDTRSGLNPRLGEVGRHLVLRTGGSGGSSAMVTIDPRTGRPRTVTSGGGSANVEFAGEILDQNGNRIGDAIEIAHKAIEAWEKLFSDIGLRP